MKNILIVLCIIGFLPFSATAQKGYLGKRIDIEYKSSIGNPWLQRALEEDPIWNGNYVLYPRFNAQDYSRKTRVFNFKHYLGINFVLSAKYTLGVGVAQAKYGSENYDDYIANEDSTKFKEVSMFGSVIEKNFFIKLKKFKHNYAPIGTYSSICLGLNKVYLYNSYEGSDIEYDPQNAKIPYVEFEYGKNVLIGKGLYLNFGGLLHYSPFYSNERERSRLYNIFRPTVGIGYIVF